MRAETDEKGRDCQFVDKDFTVKQQSARVLVDRDDIIWHLLLELHLSRV